MMEKKGWIYILYSKEKDHYYVGSTSDLEQRIEFHADKKFQSSYTTIANDWDVFWSIEVDTIQIARKIEDHIKKMKSRKYIENLKNFPIIAIKLIEKYSNN